MINLIAAIFSLLLVAAFLAANMQYLPADAKIRVKALATLEDNIEALERGADRYLESIRNPATGVIDLGSARSDLMDELAPDHLFRPRPPAGAWTAGVGAHAGRDLIWYCLEPPTGGFSDGVKQAISDLVSRKLPESSAFQADSCGATANGGAGARLTYWIDGGHRHPGSDVLAVSAPALNTAVLFDPTKAVRVRYAVSGWALASAGAGMSSAEVVMEIREPAGAWGQVDSWEVAAAHANVAGGSSVQVNQGGSIEAAVPAGWEMRVRAIITGDASATVLGGQIQRFW